MVVERLEECKELYQLARRENRRQIYLVSVEAERKRLSNVILHGDERHEQLQTVKQCIRKKSI